MSYAVVLAEVNGTQRLPIVIGAFEAQAIAVVLENMQIVRPLTHDLMKNFMHYSSPITHLKDEVEKTKFEIQKMSGSDIIVKELSVKGLATFTAFANKAVKVVFDDRTIIRM